MRIKFFSPDKQYASIEKEIDATIKNVLKRGDLILRRDGEEFEENFARYVGTKYAVGVASGTDAILLSLVALGIGPGDEVIVPSYTFRATVEAIHHAGATPVLAGLDESWEHYRTFKTKAIIPVHMEGAVHQWFSDDLIMIEDACQAVGASTILGDTACYSFYPAKLLGCYGDGGAIATNDEELYLKLKKMRNHYKDDWKPYGYNSRLDNLQAAVLNVKLKHLPDVIERRKEIALRYDQELKGVGLPPVRDLYQDYVIVHPDRDGLYESLKEKGVECMKNEYPFPEDLRKDKNTIKYEHQSLRIPCNETMTEEEVTYVIKKINAYGI